MTAPTRSTAPIRRAASYTFSALCAAAIVAVFAFGVPAEDATRAENASLREDIGKSETARNADLAETERLSEELEEKTAELTEIQAVLDSTEGFIQ